MSRILITGGTGSLGHALVAHYLKETDHRLIVYSRDELKQSVMREEFPDPRLDFFLGDVRDLPRLHLAFEASVDVVIHAAALKRVDAVSYNPEESMKTNIQGSMNVLHAARGKVKKCLLISTDKACYATTAYGRTKAMAEDLFTTFNVCGIPKGSSSAVVRYGNVLNSRGSAVIVWRRQMAGGGPLTLTDPRMTRFLLTLPRAIQMIETALEKMEGGEIFVPQLKAARMTDLMWAVHGDGGFRVEETGLRPGGEKLHETLMTDEEAQRAIPRPGYSIIPPEIHPWRLKPFSRGGVEAQRSDTAPQMDLEELKALVEGL